MYINTGNVALNTFTSKSTSPAFMIFAELVDSSISYETPVLVDNVQDLELWFGKFFNSYFYLKNLLLTSSNKVSLLLYKPEEKVYVYPEEGVNTFCKKEESNFITTGDLPSVGKNNTYYYVKTEDTYYIYSKGEWLSLSDYAARSSYNISRSNRETLMITSYSNKFFDYYNPLINSSTNSPIYRKLVISSSNKYNYLRDLNLDDMKSNNQTLSFSVVINTSKLDDDFYLIIPIAVGNNSYDTHEDVGKFNLFYVTEEGKNKGLAITDIDNKLIKTTHKDYKGKEVENRVVNKIDIPNAFYYSGYYLADLSGTDSSTLAVKFTAYTINPVKAIAILHSSNIMYALMYAIASNNSFNQQVLSNLSKNSNSVFFYSKTIGKTFDESDDDSITVKIEAVDLIKKIYKITIKKYDYEEVYEGPLVGSESYERLDYVISKNSKLVYCDFIDVALGIKEGTYTLSGAVAFSDLEISAKNHLAGLEAMLSYAKEKEIYPDYVMVPDTRKYVTNASGFKPLQDLFKIYAEDLNTQFLVTNKFCYEAFQDVSNAASYNGMFSDNMNTGVSTIYKIDQAANSSDSIVDSYLYIKFRNPISYELVEDEDRIEYAKAGNDYVFNNIDPDNRIIYFYQDCYVDTVFKVPLYYLYIQGLLNDVYSFSSNAIMLEDTVNSNPYEENDLEKNLQKYKSNYMICNNHTYYFKKMQDGSSYNTTGWMRFILGKIYRELQKNRGALVGEKFKDKIEAVIRDTLSNIETNFSIIKYLEIDKIAFNDISNSLTLSLNIGVKEVVGDDITIDYILNYNND